MSYEITGIIEEIFQTQTFESGFTKREFVLKVTENDYDNFIKFELIKDKVTFLDRIQKGSEVTVKFSLGGNKYEKDGKINYYTNARAFYISADQGEQPTQSYQPQPAQQPTRQPQQPPPMDRFEDSEDDIPF